MQVPGEMSPSVTGRQCHSLPMHILSAIAVNSRAGQICCSPVLLETLDGLNAYAQGLLLLWSDAIAAV